MKTADITNHNNQNLNDGTALVAPSSAPILGRYLDKENRQTLKILKIMYCPPEITVPKTEEVQEKERSTKVLNTISMGYGRGGWGLFFDPWF